MVVVHNELVIAPDYIITRWPALFFPVEEKRKEKKKKLAMAMIHTLLVLKRLWR